MIKESKVSPINRVFSFLACVLLLLSSVFIGISIVIPNVNAGGVNHDNGNLDLIYITDTGRIFQGINWGQAQTARDANSFGFIGLVIDHDGYDHTLGLENIADCFAPPFPYSNEDDFFTTTPMTMTVNDGTLQKSVATFRNEGVGTGDPFDVQIYQTTWTVTGKDWAIIQWRVDNIKSPAADLFNFRLGYEIPFSKDGARYGIGGNIFDGGDDIDGFDAANDVYWVRDDTGVEMGVSSILPSDPINHYYGEDYYSDYATEYRNFFGDDSWLYNRITAPNTLATDGVTPGNVTTTVGWNPETISAGTSRTYTLVFAMNNTHADMITAIQDAQTYYQNVATGFQLTEIKDEGSGNAQFEVYNMGREPTMAGPLLTFEADGAPLTGNWNPTTIPTYGYSTFTVTGGAVDPEGATITLFENSVQIDEVSYGQSGIGTDPLDTESTARRYDLPTLSYVDEWIRDPTPTWNAQNDVGGIVSSPWVVLNRVMFNPNDPEEGYVEVMYTGLLQYNISGYKIVCDDEYVIPGGTILNATNPYFVLPRSALPAFFTNMDAGADNVYFYDSNDNLIDMVGWNAVHTQGEFMARSPEGTGTYQGYNDATSGAAGWVFDNPPYMIITEFYTDSGAAQIELYNPRGGEKKMDAVPQRWTFDVLGGGLLGGWNPAIIPVNGYSTFTRSGGATPGNEGDTISLFYIGTFLEDVSYGTEGVAPDPLSTESTSRYYNTTSYQYHDEWTRDTATSFGSQNDVPALNHTSYLVLTEVMFDPSVVPDGKYVVITNRAPGWLTYPETDFYLVADDVYQLTSTIGLGTGARLIIRYGDNSPNSDNFFNSIDTTGDNVYLYDPNGGLCDMVGWDTAHTQGMSVRRVPDGNGTQDGYDDVSSTAASWVFDSPLQIQITEISDSESALNQIEIYNFWYPDVDFGVGFEFKDSTGGTLAGSWSTPMAPAGGYAVFDVTAGLDIDGDTIGLYQSGILAEEIGYGTYGTTPDPLPDESTERYWNASINQYWDIWGRNWTSTPNFGLQNDIPEPYNSPLVLNEVLFNPSTPGDEFVELYLRWGGLNISGYKIVGDTEFIIPFGTDLTVADPFYYLTSPMDPAFFAALNPNGDNVYLYDDNGTFLDEVGWSSPHTAGESVCRVPTGNGTRTGYNDVSSPLAGWQFGCTPTIQLVKVEIPRWDEELRYGSFGGIIVYNLTITNKQSVEDTILLLQSGINGYPVVIMDENMTFVVSQVTLLPGEEINITMIVTLPGVIPFIQWDNITFVAQSQNASLFRDEILLGAYVSPFIWPDKWADPTQIYVDGTGHDEVTTITLNLTGMGSVVTLINPQDVIFCVDTSGSMTPEAIDLVKQGLTGYVDEMDDPDQGAVVTFGGTAQLMNPLTNDYNQLKNDIANIMLTNLGTPMVAALQIAINELNVSSIPGHIKVIILLTDGQPSPPETADDVRAMAALAASLGILIFTIGLEPQIGALDEQLLMDVANTTGGLYFYAPTAQELPAIYRLIAAYIGDIAGRDPFPSDMTPMIRDVLPPWIQYVPGSFSIPPASIVVNSTGYTKLEWNMTSLGIGDSWEVTFQVKALDIGWLLANDVNTSRVYFVDYFDTVNFFLFPEVLIEVLPSAPIPPRLHITMGATDDDVMLYWDQPASPGTEKYLIYRSTTPTGFDFTTPWVDTNNTLANGFDPVDGLIKPLRNSWNHTGAADGTDEQWYYCIRTINNLGEISHTSRTVGKWTKTFGQGVSTFSIPLEPMNPMGTDDYTNDMNADYIKYISSFNQRWVQHDFGMGNINNITMEVGKGYEIMFSGPSNKYTFLGMPGSHIQYKTASYIGFNPVDQLNAVVNDPVTGDVWLTWDAGTAGDMDGDDFYNVYRSTTRDGFDDGTATLLTQMTWGSPFPFWVDLGAALPGTQYYYMIVAENESGVEGSSTYSIGVFTADILGGYDTLGIPLQLASSQTADWYCDQITSTVGINYHIDADQRWSWHSTVMPALAFDPTLVMADGYQISTTASTRFSFVGR